MSLATRCPECSTTFQVVPDQLRISDGWVRCGRCSRVFDANDHMVDLSAPGAASGSASQDSLAPPHDDLPFDDDPAWDERPAVEASWEQLPSLELGGADAPVKVEPSRASADFDATQPKPPGPGADEPFNPLAFLVAPESGTVRRDLDADADAESAPAIVRTPSESAAPDAARERLDPRAGEADFSFLGTPADSAMERRRRMWRGVALALLAVAAAVVLVAQVLAQSHDVLVARQPALRPAVLAWCRLAGCTVSPLRKIDDIMIDGSAFARQKGDDGYLLSFTLRNRSGLPLAMPSIELSLLDTQERPVVRRVLRPSDFGAPLVLSARGEHSAALPLGLVPAQVDALQPLIVGYHLDAFYP